MVATLTGTAISTEAAELIVTFDRGGHLDPTLPDVIAALRSVGQVVALSELATRTVGSSLEEQHLLRLRYKVLNGEIPSLRVVSLSKQSPLQIVTELPTVIQAVGGVGGVAALVILVERVFQVRPRIRAANAAYDASAEEALLRRDAARLQRLHLGVEIGQLQAQVESRPIRARDVEIVLPEVSSAS